MEMACIFKKIIPVIILITLFTLLVSGCVNEKSEGTHEIVKLQPPSKGVYHSAFPDFGGSEDNVTSERISNFEKLANKSIVLAAFSDNWGESNITFPKTAVETIHDQGAVPYLRMMPRSSLDEIDGSNPVYKPDQKYSLQKIIDGDFDTQLREYAREVKQTNIPIMIDFACEMNGNWFYWSGICNGGKTKDKYGDPALADGPEKYRDAYRHIINIFREEGANNVTWVFHVDAYSDPAESWNNYNAYYPGDDYIDWIGVSAYGSTYASEEGENFTEIMNDAYPQLESISKTKPLAVLEFGVNEGKDKPQWIKEALESIKNGKYPRIKAVSYWNENWEEDDGTTAKLRIDSSKESLEMYRQEISDPFFIDKPIFN
jgi:beta-mannanase